MKRAEGAYGGQLPEVLELRVGELVRVDLHMHVELQVELHIELHVELHVRSPCTCISLARMAIAGLNWTHRMPLPAFTLR